MDAEPDHRIRHREGGRPTGTRGLPRTPPENVGQRRSHDGCENQNSNHQEAPPGGPSRLEVLGQGWTGGSPHNGQNGPICGPSRPQHILNSVRPPHRTRRQVHTMRPPQGDDTTCNLGVSARRPRVGGHGPQDLAQMGRGGHQLGHT